MKTGWSNCMRCIKVDILTQEVPGQISIAFWISGCQIRCKGCHSPALWNVKNGTILDSTAFLAQLNRYKGLATCVLFMGGEWHPFELISHLRIAQRMGYNTCLYSGNDHVDSAITYHLTWVKTGPWRANRGGLDSSDTNQKFIETATGQVLNHLFQKTRQ